MRLDDRFTSEDYRFAYPALQEVEHHSSVDVANLPGAISVPGAVDHYVVVETEEGDTIATELSWSLSNIPASAIIQGIRGLRRGSTLSMYGDERIAPDKFDNFDDDSTYFPERPEGTSVVVSVSAPFFSHRVKDSRFNEDRVAILPAGEPLPSFAKNGVPDREVRYRLHGFINPDDKLVTHHAPTTYARQAVDWSVANAVAQNAVEKALLVDAIDPSSLLGMLSVDAGIAAYLKYYGEKHGGSYVPQEEPRSELPPLTNKEFKIYQDLAALALSSRQ